MHLNDLFITLKYSYFYYILNLNPNHLLGVVNHLILNTTPNLIPALNLVMYFKH